MSKFLVIQTAFIGDVVLATAVIEKLHAWYPQAEIHFLVRKGNEGLLKEHPFLGKVHVWNKKERKVAGLLQLAKAVRRERYTHVVNLHRYATSGFLTWYSGAPEKRGFDKNPFAWCYTRKVHHRFSGRDEPVIHETDRNQWLINDLTDDQPARPGLYPTTADYERVRPYKKAPYICIAPSSVWATKRYPIDRWAALVRAFPEGYKIYFLSGPEDAAMAEEIMAVAGGANAENLGGKLSLMQSAALMQDAVMNYTNDSGPLHFASSVNAPSTAVFCSTHACFGFGPLSDFSRLVEVPDLYCKPCGIHGYDKCPEGHFRCAKDIDIKELLWWTSARI